MREQRLGFMLIKVSQLTQHTDLRIAICSHLTSNFTVPTPASINPSTKFRDPRTTARALRPTTFNQV